MKYLFIMVFFAVSVSALVMAHEGGHRHQPKVIRSGKYGGALANVFLGSTHRGANRKKVIYVAEFVKDEEGKMSLYFYNQKMKPVPLDSFSSKASGVLKTGWEKKSQKTSFLLEKKEMSFSGTLPKNTKRPFSIVVDFIEGKRKLSVAFDHLD